MLAVVATAATAGCAPQLDPAVAPSIRFGQDVCARCGMIISEPVYAAAYRTSGGEVRLFDDIGDVPLYHRDHPESVAQFWVHDYGSREWLRGERALYVRSPSLRTPMGHGIAALGSEVEAQLLAARLGGVVMTFDDLALPPSREPRPPP